MQNMDFYTGKRMREIPSQFPSENPEYFSRMAKGSMRSEYRSMKRANRIIFLIIALCIVCFTTGLVVGIKFASGSKKEIIHETTKNAVNSIGVKVTDLIKEGSLNDIGTASKKNLFLKEKFPFVIRVGKEYNKSKSQKIADFLSNKGHTVILSKNKDLFRIFVGPYTSQEEAELSWKNIMRYSDNQIPEPTIIRR